MALSTVAVATAEWAPSPSAELTQDHSPDVPATAMHTGVGLPST